MPGKKITVKEAMALIQKEMGWSDQFVDQLVSDALPVLHILKRIDAAK